jgi:HK97 family phage prohead protease
VAPPVESEDKDRQFTFTISDPTVDRSNDTIAINGWQLGSYSKNPIVLWAHAGALLPIGRSVKLWVEGNKLRAAMQLAPKEANADPESVYQLIKLGFLRAASVGFLPIRYELSDKPDRKFGIDLQQELLEWSVVSVPANAACTIDLPAAGKRAITEAEAAARPQVDFERRQRDAERRRRQIELLRARVRA